MLDYHYTITKQILRKKNKTFKNLKSLSEYPKLGLNILKYIYGVCRKL